MLDGSLTGESERFNAGVVAAMQKKVGIVSRYVMIFKIQISDFIR